jgi:hypothetical protein
VFDESSATASPASPATQPLDGAESLARISALLSEAQAHPTPTSEPTPTKNQILQAGAELRLAEKFAIFPLSEDGKHPLSFVLNKQGYVYRFHNGIHSAYSASFGKPRVYVEPKSGKTKTSTAALQAWWDGLAVNYAIALELSGLCVADIDEGIASEAELVAFLAEFNIPVTRCIRSGRTSSFGCHLYFRGVMESGSFAIPFHGKIVKGEIKSSAPRYVVGESSFHKSGQQYVRLWDVAIEPTPVSLFTELLEKYPQVKATSTIPTITDTKVFEGDAVTCEQFELWAEKNGEAFSTPVFHEGKQAWMYIRDNGCPWEEAHVAMTGEHIHTGDNGDADFAVYVPLAGKMSAKCQHESCKAMWTTEWCWTSYRAWVEKKTGKKIPLQPSGTITFGKTGGSNLPNGQCASAASQEAEVIMSNPTEAQTPNPTSIVYPMDAWKGTLYHDYAELCGQENYIPREFFVESLKTTVGAILSKRLNIANVEGGTPRFYTVLIGYPSAGKNTAVSWATGLFDEDKHVQESTKIDGKDSSKYCLLWHPQETPTNDALGACITQVSSASGLAKFLPSISKKGDTKAQDCLLFKYTELSTMLEKCQIEGSGLALVSALCDLYDGTEFSIPALSEQKPFGGHLRLSILAGIQPERWDELASGKGIENSGIHSRWNLVPSEEKRTVPTLVKPDLSHFGEQIRTLMTKAVPLTADASALTAMKVWHNKLWEIESNRTHLTRLNILAWRNALHHAWLTGKTMIDGESVSVGTRLADYQLSVRKRYEPLIGDSRLDKAISAIRRCLTERGALSLSELKRGVNYKRLNHMFEQALAFLFRQAEVETVEGLIRLKEVA